MDFKILAAIMTIIKASPVFTSQKFLDLQHFYKINHIDIIEWYMYLQGLGRLLKFSHIPFFIILSKSKTVIQQKI